MLDENEHSRKEDGRSLHRLLHKAEQQDATVARSKTPPAALLAGRMGRTCPRNEGRSC